MRHNVTIIRLPSLFWIGLVSYTFIGIVPSIVESTAATNIEAEGQGAVSSQTAYGAIVRRFYNVVFNTGNLAKVDEFITPDYIDHNPINPGLRHGVEGVQYTSTLFRTGFADINVVVEDQIVEEDKVVSRITMRGTHKGKFMDVAPTGKQVEITGIEIYRIVSGKISERWGNLDSLALMQQLGVIEAPDGRSAGELARTEEQAVAEIERNVPLQNDELTNLDNWEALNAVFQRDIGRVRIVALLSPN